MKFRLTGFTKQLTFLMVCVVAPLTAMGEATVDQDGVYVIPGLGAHYFDSVTGVEAQIFPSLGVGFQFQRHFALELSVRSIFTETKSTGNDFDVLEYEIDMIFGRPHWEKWTNFIVVGLGDAQYNPNVGSTSLQTQGIVGYGYQGVIADRFLLRADVRGLYGFDNETADAELNVGLLYFIGGYKRPDDEDGDGVLDPFDKCPGTPRGATVDNKGCPIDSDDDGIFDGIDLCPKTPKGALVNAAGCTKDDDKDGVPDNKDKCPNTQHGVIVNEEGCPLDSDGDSVADYKDKCPETPKGAKVDDDGCRIILKETVEITLQLEFKLDSSEILPRHIGKISEVGEFMRQYPDTQAVLEGHTDSTGSEEYNQRLSRERAEAVRSSLIQGFGIKPSRLVAVGMGESRPIADNSTAEGREQNRRVVAVLRTVIEEPQ